MKRAILVAALFLASSGCTIIVSNAASNFSDNLAKAVLNQDDPELVRDGVPTLLLTMDSLIEGSPDNPQLLAAGATLYATYGAVFAENEVRGSKLTTRARRYAQHAMCESYEPSCVWPDATYDEFVASLDGIGHKQADLLFTYGFASLAFLRAHASDWDSLAELPEIEALFNHYLNISGDEVNSSVYTYMGIMLTLRPPALGGEPERAREYFEKAIAVSDGKDLSAKVEFARGYAKLLYERELHDQLLNEVIEADPNQNGFVLTNVMAQEAAAILLAEADDYF
ncbi:MAG: TRAP transporter TatT component family protein [Gammaproteobacteria bacterium]|nr:TRAP transporter TatT component family protein [Gammaproteobacteria bacterium]MDH5240815.1 TRAP transporter TatT component family protein [Gammaproteobacteria bacterium]MDH5260254.1 TRAP transporter TatT component family protein [Gammaproteobacteria bacterium]MDH5582452.1 TRAP transporter TatT component family protein [Gammaproteobacteria bacterium]